MEIQNKHIFNLLIVLMIFSGELIAVGDPVDYQFQPSTPIRSNEINANFQELADRIAALGENGSSQKQFIGISVATIDGRKGPLRMTELCQQEFDQSRVCNSKEVIETENVPTLRDGYSWVMPSYQPLSNAFAGIYSVDISGTEDSPDDLSCASSGSGIAFNYDGANDFTDFRVRECSNQYSVTCCR